MLGCFAGFTPKNVDVLETTLYKKWKDSYGKKYLPSLFSNPTTDVASSHWTCFSSYFSVFKRFLLSPNVSQFYFSHAFDDRFYRYVDEFNDAFHNIKVSVVDTKLVKLSSSNNVGTIPINVEGTFHLPLLKVDLNDEYDPLAQYWLYYLVEHIFRMVDPTEVFGYDPDSQAILNANLLDIVVILVDKKLDAYRSLSEVSITRENLKELDDVEKVNERAKAYKIIYPGLTTAKQTEAMLVLSTDLYTVVYPNELEKVLLKKATVTEYTGMSRRNNLQTYEALVTGIVLRKGEFSYKYIKIDPDTDTQYFQELPKPGVYDNIGIEIPENSEQMTMEEFEQQYKDKLRSLRYSQGRSDIKQGIHILKEFSKTKKGTS